MSSDSLTPNEDWPEELKYTDRLIDMWEALFGMNIYAHEKASIDYSILCLEVVTLWLRKIGSDPKHSERQQLALTSVLKGRRLLRAAQLQIFKGYLPEAEILLRSMIEVKLVLIYILDDPTDKRIKKYLSAGFQKVWDFRTLSEDILGKDGYQMYINLSQYPHPYNYGRTKLIHKGQLQPSSIHDYDHAGHLLVSLGDAAVALCEISNELFDIDEEWQKKHEEIFETDIFKKNIADTHRMMEEGNEALEKLNSRIEKKNKKL